MDLSLEYDSEIGKSGEVTYAWDGMMQKLNDYDLVLQGHGDQVAYMSDLEKSKAQEAKEYVIQCMLDKGVANGYTLDEMKEKLSDTYKSMTDEEKTQLEQIFLWKDYPHTGEQFLSHFFVLLLILPYNDYSYNYRPLYDVLSKCLRLLVFVGLILLQCWFRY